MVFSVSLWLYSLVNHPNARVVPGATFWSTICLGYLAGDIFSVIYSLAHFTDKVFSLVLNCCFYSCCLLGNQMTFNFWGRILYFVEASCFDTNFQKMLSGKTFFALLFPSPSPSQERHVFDSLSPGA